MDENHQHDIIENIIESMESHRFADMSVRAVQDLLFFSSNQFIIVNFNDDIALHDDDIK